MKDRGYVVAFGSTSGAPIFYSLGISRLIRMVTIGLSAAAALFSAGLFIGRISRFRFK